MFRRYWLPVLLSSELPENDCPPVRVQVLSERLIAFRDSDGQLGLIDEFAHTVVLVCGSVETKRAGSVAPIMAGSMT